MISYFDKENNRLVYIGKASNANYWDSHWDINNIDKLHSKYKSPFDYIINTAYKHLFLSAKIVLARNKNCVKHHSALQLLHFPPDKANFLDY